MVFVLVLNEVTDARSRDLIGRCRFRVAVGARPAELAWPLVDRKMCV